MSEPVYYQWQNEHLLRTIYPLREVKLRDFLVFYQEIDLWKQYKGKTLEQFPQEVENFRSERMRQWETAYRQMEQQKAYFLGQDFVEQYKTSFPDPDSGLLEKFQNMHKEFLRYFPTYKDPRKERYYLTARIQNLENARKEIDAAIASRQRAIRNMGPTWKKTPLYQEEVRKLSEVSQKMLDQELGRLYTFLSALDITGKHRLELKKWFDLQEKEAKKVEAEATKQRWMVKRFPDRADYARTLQEVEARLGRLVQALQETRRRPEKEQLEEMAASQAVTLADLLNGKIERYRSELSAKSHDELLEAVVQRFLKEPRRYPLWLQYMVIHFSGMRYKSAHGSWADPKDLVLALSIKDIEKRMGSASDETIEAECQEKIAAYQPRQAQADTQIEKDRIAYHLRGLSSPYPYRRRKALLDLLVEEENERVSQEMNDAQALEALEAMKDRFPDWMWKEIVARTELRIREVKSGNWEELTPEEMEKRLAREWDEFRAILVEWKKQNLTGWREEHDRTNRLIVTRAVCNEVAEHIQHIRGNSPPGGLTAKPRWYLTKEGDPRLAKRPDKPFFVKPKDREDFKAGASLLWLRWVDRMPNAWQIATPITLKNGEGLLPGGTALTRNRMIQVEQPPKNGDAGAKRQPKTIQKYQKQWLRWIHEATIAEVAETAEGPVVLTFETALPYEPRLQSTIGVFKHNLNDLKYSVSENFLNGTFVGYTPEEAVPYEDLREMLDWNKVLRRSALSPEEIEAYWNQVTVERPVSFGFEMGEEPAGEMPEARGMPSEALPPGAPAPGEWDWKPREWILWSDLWAGLGRALQRLAGLVARLLGLK